ncbi:MAG: STAS domain-containing protein [Planctomycetes bacterium]|nr:STAS domain-containing protein [Planctomycetota bacterium]
MGDEVNNLVKGIQKSAEATIVVLAGDVDLRHSPALHAALVEVANERPKRLVLNLTDVPYMDSSGVGTLVEVFRRVNKYDGKLVLCGLTARCAACLRLRSWIGFFRFLRRWNRL